jgi:hypothetical protein
MRAGAVFVGFLRGEPGHHRSFTTWHDTDHRPENVGRIRHVYHSERWVAPVELVARREITGAGPTDDFGHYVHTYWSMATPAELSHDMTAVRERLEVLGRCQPINRDFVATWRDRTYPVHALVAPDAPASADALPVAPNSGVVVTLFGAPVRPDQELEHYYTDVLPAVVDSDGVMGVYTLRTGVDAAGNTASSRIAVQLCYVSGDPLAVQARLGEIERRLGDHPGVRLFRGAYVPSTPTDPTPYD